MIVQGRQSLELYRTLVPSVLEIAQKLGYRLVCIGNFGLFLKHFSSCVVGVVWPGINVLRRYQ